MATASDQPAVEARGVRKTFDSNSHPVVALDDVSIAIRQNEFFTLLGPSGCGKTTLLRLIAGFDWPDSGQILLDEQNITGLPPFKRPINTVFQNYALFPHMSVAQNVGFGLAMLGKSRREIDTRVDEMLALVRMQTLRDRNTTQLSGGQQQRVALARALAPAPRVLLLDEPLSALDYKLRKEMQIELKRLQHETGITFVFVTHDQEEALTMSDRIAVMSAGRVLQIGTPPEIYERPSNRFVADFIGESNFLEGRLESVADDEAVVRLNSGRRIAARLARRVPENASVTVVVRPEHAKLVSNAEGVTLVGTLQNIVYFGTDTHYHVLLDGGDKFVVRVQNNFERETKLRENDQVGISLARGAASVLTN